MTYRTKITLSRAAFTANISKINDLTGHTSLALVVKSNAYGHGILPIAQMADHHRGVSWICTAGIKEALFLRNKGITKPLLTLSYLDHDLDEAIRRGIHLGVSSFEEAQAVAASAVKSHAYAYIHVKIDTGMGRMGLLPEEAVATIVAMTKLPHVTVFGVFTHLSDTGHEDLSYCEMQLERFDTVLDELGSAGVSISCTHAQSSSSLNFKPKRAYSFIRVGASAYGLWKTPIQRNLLQSIDPSFDLIPVAEWRAHIVHIKKLPTGSAVGYQRTFITERPSSIALVPIGYWDGYPYALSNKGIALLKGHQVSVAGKVSMNLMAFDVTDVPQVAVGDEVILMGNAPLITPHDIGLAAGMITNEVTTALHHLIQRKIVPYHESITLATSEGSHKLYSLNKS